ncbi:MAG: AraC family transcriptional regulator [Verrucomicrobia bacterium]|nr:AraC family transcriptional regulator [Verrucomicrobiota bacterium]
MRYQEYQPPIELASWIKLFWVFESRSNDPVPETIVADGFPELIIHFRSPFSEVDRAGQLFKQSSAVACGQLTKPLVLHSSLDAGMIGIRFQPSGMAPFLSTSMQTLTDARVPAENLFVDIDRFLEEIAESSNDAQRIAACNRFLLRSINLDRENLCARRALESIMLARGRLSVESLAAGMGTSRRSLESTFQREVGTSPKMYCRIARFRHLFDAMSQSGPSVNWVQLALDSGFFDQPHMIRDFRQFTGKSPTSFLTDQRSFAHSVNQV